MWQFLRPDLAHIFRLQKQVQGLCATDSPQVDKLSDLLDELDHSSRLAALRSLSARHLRHIYEAVEGHRSIGVDFLVPSSRGAMDPVRHFGKNSLPAFSIFEKRFLRPEKGARELWGYNHQSMSPITGPGYFVAYDSPRQGEGYIDYTRLPPRAPEFWPAMASNTTGLSRFVYGHMVDRLRGLSQHVSIGRAWRHGKEQNAWFVLCRDS